MDNKKEVIDSIFQKTTKNKLLHEAVLLVEDSYGKFSYHLEYGGKGIDTPFLIASITKLFTTSCIFILKDQGRLSLDDPLIKYIDKEKLQYLHIYRGQEFSEQLTIAHLLCHT